MSANQPAFPRPMSSDGHGFLAEATLGMTMRQYYKGAALQVIDSRYSNVGNESACAYEIARYCGMIADALLAEDEEHAKK